MASRQEEKEQRRREREEAEQAAKRGEARRKRIGMVVGGVLVAALIAVVAVVALGGGDDGGGGGGDAKAPTFGEKDLEAAAKAANCELKSHELEGSTHTSKDVEYKTNPPTSGDHDPVPAEDGVYADGPPDLEQSVHALEHGRINFQYRADSPAERVGQLEAMTMEEIKGTEGYHSLMFENQTGMDAAVAATAWVDAPGKPQSLTCAEWNDQVFDAFRAFRLEYVDKGPEFIP
jgi:hypothetical protein